MHTPLPIHLKLTETTDWLTLPASPGVVLLCAHDGQPVQIAATGNARQFCKERLDPDAELGPKADLRPITGAINAVPVGSALEADLCTLALAQTHLPTLAKVLVDRARVCVLAVDPATDSPAWKKTDLRELVRNEQGIAAGTSVLGPFTDSAASGRYADLLDSIFELCRYPRELALAPNGSPCAYKDMGCPAACDGSEPMAEYQKRLRQAVDFAQGKNADLQTQLTQQMNAASQSHNFESASRCQAALERVKEATASEFRSIGAIDRLAVLAVLPSEKFSVARVLLLAGGEVTTLADVHTDLAAEAWDDLHPRIKSLVTLGHGHRLNSESAARLGVWCRHWFRPVKKSKARRATFFQIRDDMPSRRVIVNAVRFAAAATEHDAFADSPSDKKG